MEDHFVTVDGRKIEPFAGMPETQTTSFREFMPNETVRALQREAFEINVANGWHDLKKRASSQQTIQALIVSELAEALEAYRIGRMQTYYHCTNEETCGDDTDAPVITFDVGSKTPAFPPACPHCASRVKPEGFGVEIADAMIRVIDRAERIGFDLPRGMRVGVIHLDDVTDVSEQIYCLMSITINAPDEIGEGPGLALVWRACEALLQYHKLDAEALIREKLAYNRTRGFRHGNKAV